MKLIPKNNIQVEFTNAEWVALIEAIRIVEGLARGRVVDNWNEMFPWSDLPCPNAMIKSMLYTGVETDDCY